MPYSPPEWRSPRREPNAQRRSVKNALWSMSVNRGFPQGVITRGLSPRPSEWADEQLDLQDDEHAPERRALARARLLTHREKKKLKIARGKGHSTCAPLTIDSQFEPEVGRARMYSKFEFPRDLDGDVAALLDPRAWDDCSDIFEETTEVHLEHGRYVRADESDLESKLGRPWTGLLYEYADTGPFAVENILQVDFDVHPERGQIERVDLVFELFDSLRYSAGALEFPGMMRQNNGYVRAKRLGDDSTVLECLKVVRFGRLTRWGGGGAFDYGEFLNYMAAAFLSLWVNDIAQTIPCCESRRKSTRRKSQRDL